MIKMKKILSLSLVMIMCLGMFPISASAEGEVSAVSNADYAFNENEIVFTFANLSDPHIGFGDNSNILRKTLATIKKYA